MCQVQISQSVVTALSGLRVGSVRPFIGQCFLKWNNILGTGQALGYTTRTIIKEEMRLAT